MSQTRVIVNPLSGEQIIIRRTAAETGGSCTRLGTPACSGWPRAEQPRSPEQTETFTVLEGRMKFRVGLAPARCPARPAGAHPGGNGAPLRQCWREPGEDRGGVASRARDGRTAGNGRRLGPGAACQAGRRLPRPDGARAIHGGLRARGPRAVPADRAGSAGHALAGDAGAAARSRTSAIRAVRMPPRDFKPMSAIEVAALVKRYRGAARNAVDDISFTSRRRGVLLHARPERGGQDDD